MTNNQEKRKSSINVYLFWPVGLGILILLISSIFVLKRLQQESLDQEVRDHTEHAANLFDRELEHEAADLAGLLELMGKDHSLQQLWLQKDRQALYEHTSSFYNESCLRDDITHYYFHDTDRTCFLRVHQPERYGDTISRYTLDQAIQTGETAWGVELGPLGTFTLRVVKPWRIDGRVQGYLELGREVDHIVRRVDDSLGVELFFVISKRYLNRSDWEEGMAMLYRKSNWDQFNQFVLIAATLETVPRQLNSYLHSFEGSEPENHLDTILCDITLGERRLRGKPVNISDAGGRNVGNMLVLVNTNLREVAIQRLSLALIIAYVTMFGLLSAVLYYYFRKIKQKLNISYASLSLEIDEHKKTKYLTEQQNRFLNNIIESFSHPFYVVDINTYQVAMANSTASPSKLTPGTSCHALVHKKDTPCYGTDTPCPLQMVKRTGQPVTVEHVHYDPVGNRQYFEIHCYPLFDENRKVTHAIEYSLDITERKMHQRLLEKAKIKAEEANRLKSEFLANMSHEIRTPLNSIIGFGELLSAEVPQNTELVDFAKTIVSSGQLLLDLINEILDLSKIEAGKMELEFSDVDLRAVQKNIETLIHPLAEKNNVAFTTDFDEALPETIRTDRGRLHQCLLNLASNAVKFTGHGSVDIHFYAEDILGKQFIRIDVKDSGIGIPESKLESIFDPFTQADGSTTRKFGGTGLGLAITRRLVNMMGGELFVSSKVGQGSVFSIQMPTEPTAEMKEKTEAPDTITSEHNGQA